MTAIYGHDCSAAEEEIRRLEQRIAELEAKNAILEAAISVANARKALQPDTAVEEK